MITETHYFVFHTEKEKPLVTVTVGGMVIIHLPFIERVRTLFSLLLTGRVQVYQERVDT